MNNKFKLFVNNNEKSRNIEVKVKEKLISNGFIYEDDNFDIAIAIGGDGSFLRMVKQTNFNSNILYIGINAGTLGFAQEISISELDLFIDNLKNNNYKVDEIGVQETTIIANNSTSHFYSLNEIVVRNKELNTLKLDIKVNNELLEKFIGDGVLISTSFGSTAYNLSFNGSIIYNTFHALEITPVAPLNNKVYSSLVNSVIIPENMKIELSNFNDNSLLITVDGENNYYDNVSIVETVINQKRIKIMRNLDYEFIKKINEKFLK